jgi:hypothetical protein
MAKVLSQHNLTLLLMRAQSERRRATQLEQGIVQTTLTRMGIRAGNATIKVLK